MPHGTFRQRDIPEAMIDAAETIARNSDPPPTSVTRSKQPDGRWMLTIVYPPVPAAGGGS